MAFPHVGPAACAAVLAGATLETVPVAGRVGLGGSRFVEQSAQVDEVLLGSEYLLEVGGAPFGDEGARCHGHVGLASCGDREETDNGMSDYAGGESDLQETEAQRFLQTTPSVNRTQFSIASRVSSLTRPILL